jgi:omega-hydroxy-beta-dihydromenaquinone-9 sulfotransferase
LNSEICIIRAVLAGDLLRKSAMTADANQNCPAPPTRAKATNPPPWWQLMIWAGANSFAWMRLLSRNRFRIHWSCLHVVTYVTFVSMGHTLLRGVQQLIYGRRVARTPIDRPPIFIIGHWRTGTTLLHEYLALDDRHVGPSTYECMEPNHFLLTEGLISRWLPFFSLSVRPMDNMAAGFDRPQEDEFALCNLGLPSPYLTIAFPNHPPQFEEYLDLEGLSPRALATWKRTFLRFLKELTFKHDKRLVLKSPTHSCRVKTLLEMFPDARFVHIVRDPYVVFPSTVSLWKSLYITFGLQRPTFQGLEEHVLQTFVRVYDKIEEGKTLIDFDRFYELRYEDLVGDPVGEMAKLYDHLGLGGFETVLPRLQAQLAATADYRTNRYQLSDQQRAEVTRRWGPVIRQYGYEATSQPMKNEPSASERKGKSSAETDFIPA